jgi:ABC-type glycerol-3-phosphate transport system permease component
MKRFTNVRFLKDLFQVIVTFAALGILVFPFLWVVLTSIRPESALFSKKFQLFSGVVTLANYTALLASDFPRYIANSALVSLPATILSVGVSFLAAYSFSRRTFRFRYGLLIVMVFSQLIPFIIITTPIYLIYSRLGMINTYQGLIFTYIAISIPFSVYMLIGYLDSVPRELDEAATIDGCSTLRLVFQVLLPVAWPGVAATAIYTFIRSWNDFLFALTLITKNELKTVPIGLANFFGQYTTQWDLVMSASVLATLPTLVIFLFLQRQLVSGLAAGAVKS